MTKLQHGDRIRMTSFDVLVDVGGTVSKQKVALRHAWTGPTPEHSCVASTCEDCRKDVTRIVTRRASTGSGKVDILSITPTHDGQPKGGYVDRKAIEASAFGHLQEQLNEAGA